MGYAVQRASYVTKHGINTIQHTLSTIRHSCVASNSCCRFEIKGSMTKCSFISAETPR